jgi:hypothetical protein
MQPRRVLDYRWAARQDWSPYCPTMRVIPSLDLATYRAHGGMNALWPAPRSHAVVSCYVPVRRQRQTAAGLGLLSPLISAAEAEITTSVERTVIRAFKKWVLPPIIGAGVMSVFAFALALAAYRRT